MNATIFSNNIPLGTVELKIIDEAMNVVGGIIIPNDNYMYLQPAFRRSKGSYTNELAGLNLVVQLENGCYLVPVGALSINDYEEFPDEITIDALGIQRHVMDSFFLAPFPEPFLKEPWYPINIERKNACEAELKNEISQNQHKLSQAICIAYAHFGPNDDVLFHIRDRNEISFSVVHLTWKREPESSAVYPYTEYYETFDEFIEKRMNTDESKWD